MLTISKPLSAGQAQTYHQKEFTSKEQNYWSQRGVIAGEWQGRLAEQFGLAGTVSAENFAKLSQGQHPQTGEQRPMNIRMPTAKPSRRWSTEPGGMRPFPRRNLSRSPR
jgi:TrwC relaxase